MSVFSQKLGFIADSSMLAEPLPLESLETDNGSLVLRRLLRLYLNLPDVETYLPAYDDIDLYRVWQIGMADRIHLVNVGHPDPEEFFFESFARQVPYENGRDFTGEKLSDYPVRPYVESVLGDYAFVRESGMPAYHRCEAVLRGRYYPYRRLILPLTSLSDRRRVSRLLVGIDPSHMVFN